jgi:aspartyl protease family protein
LKKKIIYLLFLTVYVSYGQELTVNETLDYINNKLSQSKIFTLNKNGDFYFINLFHSSLWDKGLGQEDWKNKIKEKNYQIELSDINKALYTSLSFGQLNNVKFSSRNDDSFSYIYFNCQSQKCLTEIEFLRPALIKSETKYTSISSVTQKISFDDNEKILRAIGYLQNLIKYSDEYKKKDDDPFASKNYNKNIGKLKEKEAIDLINNNGVFIVPILINGEKLEFILDSGASEISISKEVEQLFIFNGTIKKENYLEPALYRIANGNIISCRRVNLGEVKIGNITIRNVVASIGISNTPLLLGRNFFDNFNSWTIDNQTNRLILN